jgi:hypothetical protein
MNKYHLRAFLTLLAMAAILVFAPGCVEQRPARNGVFNENQYIRKDFLIRNGSDDDATDPGWILKATVTQVSTPDPIGDSPFGIFAGAENGGDLVRFVVTQDKLQMLSMRQISSLTSPAVIPDVENAWPITNVDLKYRVNLDGEKTNFYEENQELDWQVRQWVKINFAKNDLSDVAPLGSYTAAFLANCVDIGNSSTTLVTDSFLVDEVNDYMQWTVQITAPLLWDDATCVTAYGPNGDTAARLGRQTETFNLMYSLVRANPAPTYVPLEIAEKDPIRHKYGPIQFTTIDRDPTTGLLAARQLVDRFDPTKPIVWYFAEGFPTQYMSVFTQAGGIADQTNQLFKDASAAAVAAGNPPITATVSFKNFDEDLPDGQAPRQYGDVRYNFLRWVSDEDMQSFFAGVTQFVIDPRTGESLSSSITFNDFAIQDYYVQRIDAYLQMIGATPTDGTTTPDGQVHVGVNAVGEWVPQGACTTGSTMAIVPSTVAANHNGNSSLYQKMQVYLNKPAAQYGNLGPQDFIVQHTVTTNGATTTDSDFYRAFYALAPYYIFADPTVNPFVIPEGGGGVLGGTAIWPMMQQEAQFQALAAQIDQGNAPFEDVTGPDGLTNAVAFLNNLSSLSLAHQNYVYSKNFIRGSMHMDTPDAFSFEAVMAKDARHCINGQWETKEQWSQDLVDTYWSQVMWHEFGHSLGLEHNFMASVDGANFPTYQDAAGTHYALYASSVMEYNAEPDRVFWHPGWAPYDQGAISFIYANNTPRTAQTCNGPTDTTACGSGSTAFTVTGACPTNAACSVSAMNPISGTISGTAISGQLTPTTSPWLDPHGFATDPTTMQPVETQYLYCNESHLKYTPFCRQGDLGVTPSEIIANEIDNYEWQYQWRNFRLYRKIWDDSAYANAPMAIITDMRRFLSMWNFDWSTAELADTLRRIGITNPDPMSSDLEYYTALTNKFNDDISMANQLVGAFHESVIQQSSGERPYRTVYDPYYGDVTQQGIILDKLFAMQGWVALWPTDNYDQNQAGSYISSWATVGDASYTAVAESAVVSMIGGQYDVYPYFVPLAVTQFAQDTHSVNFSGNPDVRNWIGGHVFTRLEDFLQYFQNLAVENSVCPSVANPGQLATNYLDCAYDPRPLGDNHNRWVGPDKTIWIWAYLPDRNEYVALQQEYNTASYLIVYNYNDFYVAQLDDGNFPGGVFGAELPVKYYLDSFNQFN